MSRRPTVRVCARRRRSGTLGGVDGATEYLVLDLASLRYQWNAARTAVAVLTAAGELLAVADTPPGTDEREAAFAATDAALARARVNRPGPTGRVRYRVALYNPYSGEVSVGAVPDTRVFGDGDRLELPAAGAPALLSPGPEPVLGVAGAAAGELRPLPLRQVSFAALTRVYQAHAD